MTIRSRHMNAFDLMINHNWQIEYHVIKLHVLSSAMDDLLPAKLAHLSANLLATADGAI
jgi:hypothetical protein